MPDQPRRRRLSRLFAPLALVLSPVRWSMWWLQLERRQRGRGGRRPAHDRADVDQGADQNDRPRRRTRARYTIKAGDTLGGIAEKTGVSVERIEALNPELDPQALVAGQRIKLRE